MNKHPKTLSETRKAILEMTFCTEQECAGFGLCFRAMTKAEAEGHMAAGVRVSLYQKRRACFKKPLNELPPNNPAP